MTTKMALKSTHADTRWFYVWMAGACALIAFAGFTPTYWARVTAGTFTGAPIVHLHGLLFSLWVIFFLVQTTLAATGRIDRHRAFGLAGISLATAMVFVGVIAEINTIRLSSAAGTEAAVRAFAIIPLTVIAIFACLITAAVANIARPEIHKRLMLTATITILQPGIARLFAFAAGAQISGTHPPPLLFSLGPGFVGDALLIVAIIYDWRTRGRPHPVYLIAGAIIVVVQIIRVPLATTQWWYSVTVALTSIMG
jgi:hypothetical protein